MSDAERVAVVCPHCGGPMVWRRYRRYDGEITLALVQWPCRCPLTPAEWAAVIAAGQPSAEASSPMPLPGDPD